MPKFIAGFLFGVAATLAVVYSIGRDPSPLQVSSTIQSADPNDSSDRNQAISSGSAENSAEAEGRATDSSTNANDGEIEAVRPASAEPLSITVPEVSQPQSPGARRPNTDSTTAGQRPSGDSGSNDYPPEIADMIENNVDKELQARYEADEREESWATYMEGQLAAYFAQKPALSQFNISLIDCRTSVCAVHVLGYGVDALTVWNSATADLISQPWFEFNSMSMNRRNPQPDILGIVLIATKKPPE